MRVTKQGDKGKKCLQELLKQTNKKKNTPQNLLTAYSINSYQIIQRSEMILMYSKLDFSKIAK